MNELRERIAEIIGQCIIDRMGTGISTEIWTNAADTIIALIPKPTVWVTCPHCTDGQVSWEAGGKQTVDPCTCTDGRNEHEIVWGGGNVDKGETTWQVTLTLLDLLDADVRNALTTFDVIHRGKGTMVLPHNKGTLRIGAVKEG